MNTSLEEVLRSRRVIACVGVGGVGKTTVAAALALGAARLGRRAIVITIDPARRLADALGAGPLGHEPSEIPRSNLDALGVPAEGTLSAMMLDMKRTFDDLVERLASDAETRDRILGNPIYQHVSDALAGSAEYSAMEKVYELAEREEYDLVVVDTPPSQHALDFLEAPQRLLEFLDSRLVKMLVHPAFAAGRFGFRLFHRSTQRVLSLIERVSGIGFLQDISDFLLAFEDMSEGFRGRAEGVRGLLLGPESGFVLTTGPSARSIDDAADFLEHLEETGVPVVGVVANRVRGWPGGGTPPALPEGEAAERAGEALARALAATDGEGFPAEEAARAALAAVDRYAAAVMRDHRETERLVSRARAEGRYWRRIPEMRRDVCDLESLSRLAEQLFATAEVGNDAA